MYVAIVALFLAAFAQHAHAAEPLTIYITDAPTIDNSGISNTLLITAEEIQRRQPRNLLDILRDVPGLHVGQPGGPGGISSIYLRGGDPNFTLVIVDGVKVNDPTDSRGGSYDLSGIDPAGIERIEILRGPAATVYGAEALSGVINIITRDGRAGPRGGVEIEAGAGIRRLRGTAASRRGVFDSALAAEYRDERDSDLGSTREGAALQGSFGVTALPGDQSLRLGGRIARSDAAAFPDDSGGPKFAVLRDAEKREADEWLADLHYRRSTSARTALYFDAGVFRREEDTASPGVAPGVRDPFGIPALDSNSRFSRIQGTFRGEAAPAADWRVSGGVAAEYQDGQLGGVLDPDGLQLDTDFDMRRRSWAPFVETGYQATDRLLLEGALHLDLPDDFRRQWSPRLGARYATAGNATVWRINASNSFKLPSFYALGHPLVGNPDLKPESGRDVELSVEQRIFRDGSSVTLTAYRQRYRDLIDFDAGPPPRLVNRSRVTTNGIELSGRLVLSPRFEASAYLDRTDTDVEGSNEPLRNRPDRRAGLALLWLPRTDVSVRLDAHHVGKVRDSSVPTGDRTLDDYVRVDLAVRWQVATQWSAALAIDNFLDENYEEAIGFAAPGRRARIQVQAEF